MYCCIQPFKLSDYASIAQISIAITNLMLAFYIFVYQKKQNERVIRLQWFKELIVQPNLKNLHNYYENLEQLLSNINSDTLTEDEIVDLNRQINDLTKTFRVTFWDAILHIDKDLYNKIKGNVEELVSKLTTTISDDENKLTNSKTRDRAILDPIRYSRNTVLAMIYQYNGNLL